MASATGIPERPPADDAIIDAGGRETEPLLGRPGDAAQHSGQSFLKNLVLGELGNCLRDRPFPAWCL